MIAQLAGLQQLVAFTFILTFFATSAAAVFLLVERNQVGTGSGCRSPSPA